VVIRLTEGSDYVYIEYTLKGDLKDKKTVNSKDLKKKE
jgi:hypothetical protein